MTTALARLAGLFVVPATPVATGQVETRAAARDLVVLGHGAAGVRAGLAAAHGAAHEAGGTAVCCVWGAEAGGARGGFVGASRLVRRLVGRGHAAAARGRVAVVALSGDAGAAAEELARVRAAAGGVPVVVVVACARVDAWEPVIAAADCALLVVADGVEGPLAEAALVDLADAHPQLRAAVVDIGAGRSAVRTALGRPL